MASTSMADVAETHSRLADIGIASKFAVRPPALMLEAQDVAVLAELASYAVRRGFTRKQALQEIASRHPHKFCRDSAAGLTCTECGRSEIFSIHVRESK